MINAYRLTITLAQSNLLIYQFRERGRDGQVNFNMTVCKRYLWESLMSQYANVFSMRMTRKFTASELLPNLFAKSATINMK
jgi:hypothetical protein